MNLAPANISEASDICDLINSAYRSGIGWTTESNLVSGNRVSVAQIQEMIASQGSVFLVHRQSDKIIACICVEPSDGTAHIGAFAVAPELQGSGLGSAVILAAEQYAKDHLFAAKYSMLVLEPRHELISYYERRGYLRTGKTMPFPTHLNVGAPIGINLLVIELEKNA